MAEKQTLPQELINQLKNHNIANQELIVKFGQIEMQIQELGLAKDLLIEELTKQRETEKSLSKILQSTYGDGNINLETGEFTPIS